jgi:hypothetical protein
MPRVKKNIIGCTQGRIKHLSCHGFRKGYPCLQKKVSRAARARVSPVGQPRNFHGLGTRYNRLQMMNLSCTNIKTTLLTTMYHCVLRLLTWHILQQCAQHARVRDSCTVFCHRVRGLLQCVLYSGLRSSKNNECLALKKCNSVYIRSYKVTYHDTVFENVTPVYKKKSPGQPARARVAGRSTPQFLRFGDSLQPFTGNESLAYKHKNNVINNNVLLCITTVGMIHFTTVCATRARAWLVYRILLARVVTATVRVMQRFA